MSSKGTLASIVAVLALASGLPACLAAAESDPGLESSESTSESGRSIIGGTPATTYPEAVLVNMKVGGQVVSICSGSVIAPKVVLTAGHCVHGYTGWDIKAPYAGGQTAWSTSAATYDWDNDGEYVDPNQHDIGLVFLSKAITLSSYPKIASAPVPSGTKVINVGRIRDGVASYSALYQSAPIKVYPGASYGFPLDYAATEVIQSGDSGGPDFLPGPAPHTIVAVNSGSGGGTEILARVDLLHGWIQEQIAAPGGMGGGGSSPTPAPTCSHGLCTEGAKLANGCDPCVSTICAADPYCCQTAWDAQCVSEVASICGQNTCN